MSMNYPLYRNWLLFLACFQTFLASGIIYGWASLYTLFIETNVYGERCPKDEPFCDAQKAGLHMIYTVASSLNLASQLPWGYILDKWGPRVCLSLSMFGVIIGLFVLGIAAPDNDTYLLGVAIFGASGPGVQNALFHVSELFPHRKSTIMAIISGAFQLGFVVFLLLKQMWETFGITLRPMLMGYCVLLTALFILGLFIWPDRAFSQDDFVGDSEPLLRKMSLDTDDRIIEPSPPAKKQPPQPDESFCAQLCSPAFAGVLIWMAVSLFWANFYIGTVVEQMYTRSGDNPPLTRWYTNIFNLSLPLGVLGIPTFGRIADKKGFTWSIIATTILAIMFSGLNLLSSLPVQILTFFAYAFFRTFLFSLMFSYVAAEFGFANFGVLTGLILCFAGAVATLQYPLGSYAAKPGNLETVNVWQFFSLTSTILFAFFHNYLESKLAEPVKKVHRERGMSLAYKSLESPRIGLPTSRHGSINV